MNKIDLFSKVANTFDSNPHRQKTINDISNNIFKEISFSKDMEIMDFGSGTGALLSKIAPYVKKVTAVDISPAMNEQLKLKTIDCELEIVEQDITQENLDRKFNSIISSMTIHHIKDVQKLFISFYNMLKDNGTIAIADLEKEDGTFHTNNTGVFHFGFEMKQIENIAKSVGFINLKTQTVTKIKKENKSYSVFLLTGNKNSNF